MKRPGTRASYDKLLARIRDRVPGVSLRTTFIVGFPGETDQDFDELVGFVNDTSFDHLGVFTYSHEEGTTAFTLTDDVPAAVKRKRQSRLMARQKQIVAKRQKQRVGDRARLLVDGPSPDHELVIRGRLSSQAPDIDPQVYLTDCDPAAVSAGDFLDVEIVGARGYDLIARPAVGRACGAGGRPFGRERPPLPGGMAAPLRRAGQSRAAFRRPQALSSRRAKRAGPRERERAPLPRAAGEQPCSTREARATLESPVEVWETRVGPLPTFCV